jgi:hypothetical protein
VRGGSPPRSAVSCVSSLVTASNGTFFSGGSCGRGDGGVPSLCVLRDVDGGAARVFWVAGPSASAFGVIPEEDEDKPISYY